MIVPVNSGLQSFNDVSEILLRVRADVVLPDSQTFRDIRRRVVHMKQQMKRSENIAAGELETLNRQTELLTAEQSRLARQKKEKELQLDLLQKKLGSYTSTLGNYEEALGTQRRNLESAEEILKSMKKRREDAELMRNVGLGLMLIPVAGWIVGE